jgi:hypothetical protein
MRKFANASPFANAYATPQGVMNHEAVMKNIMPVILAGVLGIYGLITAAILVQSIGASKVHTYFA